MVWFNSSFGHLKRHIKFDAHFDAPLALFGASPTPHYAVTIMIAARRKLVASPPTACFHPTTI